MRILISGSNGVIGKEIAYQLSKNKKYKLFLLGNKKVKKKRKEKINFFYQDITKPINLKIKVDAIVHCAAKHPFSKSGNSMKKIYSTNINMTKNLIKFSNKNNVKKVFFLSSMDVYGLIKNRLIFENQKPLKSNLYGKSKYYSEKLFCNKNNKFQAVCLRMPGIFTMDLTKDHPLIIKILKKVMNNEDVPVYNVKKDFNNILDTDETVKFIKIALKKKKKQSDVYNFSASRPIKFIAVINLIKKMFKSKSQIIINNSSKTSFIISNKKLINNFNFKITTTEKIIQRCCMKILKKNYMFS